MVVDMLVLRQAIEASWQPDTAFGQVSESGNPALGHCYDTSRVVQHYFPEAQIVEGRIITPTGEEKHFWTIFKVGDRVLHVDLTWQQFPHGSYVKSWFVRDRDQLNDGPETIKRIELVLQRVQQNLQHISPDLLP
ncbi:MAG TPA: hypothetical protein VJ843_04225 [Candidatus Saccharimonadales bacterium]|nr:hypothetical protein [Candidatus Saccharimonadales bacterium]